MSIDAIRKTLDKYKLYEISDPKSYNIAADHCARELQNEFVADERPTHRHINRGSSYKRVFEKVEVQTSRPIVEGDELTVYRSKEGKVWARLDAR